MAICLPRTKSVRLVENPLHSLRDGISWCVGVYLVVGPRHHDGVADIVKQLEQEVDREILDEATLGRTNERERDAGVATGRFDDMRI
jgi:hypothetical protein